MELIFSRIRSTTLNRYGISVLRTSLFLLLLFPLLIGCGPGRGPMEIDADAPTEFTTTESGLKYRILRASSGAKPSPTDSVQVDYSGWLDNDTVFDSSYNRRKPATFRLNGVIPAWTEGLQLIGEGGMIELEVPPALGYGEQGTQGIPPHSTLHFKVELHQIK